MSSTTVNTTTTSPDVKIITVGKFNGALSRFQLGAYYDLVWCNVPHQTAHKMAMDFGADLGRLMATDADFAAKIGKANKNGMSRISLSGADKITTSRTMSVIRVAQQMWNLNKEGIIVQKDMPELAVQLREYVTECTAWAATQNWAK